MMMRMAMKVVLAVMGLMLSTVLFTWGARLATTPNDVSVAVGVLLMLLVLTGLVTAGRYFLWPLFERVGRRLKSWGVNKQKLLILAVVLSVVGLTNCTRIGPGYVGIVINMSGNQKGVENIPTTTGWTWYNPITQSVYEYPTFVQTAKWTKDLTEGHPVNEEITFTNKDSMLIAVDISLSYTLKSEKVPAFYVMFRTDNLDQFTHGFLRNVARDSFNETAGRYSIEQIMGDNGPFLSEVKEKVQKQVDPIGVHLEQFGFIGAPRPPESVITAINMKVQAQQIALQKQTEILQAQAEAQKSVARAEGEAKARIAVAEGEAKANQLVSGSLTPSLLEWRRLQINSDAVSKWNGIRPNTEVNGGGNTGFLMSIGPK